MTSNNHFVKFWYMWSLSFLPKFSIKIFDLTCKISFLSFNIFLKKPLRFLCVDPSIIGRRGIWEARINQSWRKYRYIKKYKILISAKFQLCRVTEFLKVRDNICRSSKLKSLIWDWITQNKLQGDVAQKSKKRWFSSA